MTEDSVGILISDEDSDEEVGIKIEKEALRQGNREETYEAVSEEVVEGIKELVDEGGG